MSIERNGISKKYKILHNGQKLKKAFYNGKIKLWSAGNNVTYNVDTNDVHTEEVDEGETCLAPKTFTPQKSGWTFMGWRKDTQAVREVETKMVMGDDPISLYGAFAEPVTLMYDGNGADITDTKVNYSWQHIVGEYKDDLVISNHSKLGRCAKFMYVKGNRDLNARLSLNTPIPIGGDIAPNTNYVGVEMEFIIDADYTNANGYDLYVSKSIGNNSYHSVIRFKIKHGTLCRYNYLEDGSYSLTEVAALKWADVNQIKIVVDKANGYCTYFLNDVCVESNLPPIHSLDRVPDIGVVCIYTPSSSENVVNDLYVSKLAVYEISQEGKRSYIVNEDYSNYAEGALIVNSRSGIRGAIGYDKADYYNNGNTSANSFTLIKNPFTKSGYSFAGWDVGLPGKSITLAANKTTVAQWAITAKDYSYSGDIQTYTATADGFYLLEVWGAQGGDAAGFKWGDGEAYSPRSGGFGGYSKGQISLSKGQTIYICVGGQGGSLALNTSGVSAGGYNGGASSTQIDSSSRQCTGGGGCTHIGTFDTTLAEHNSKEGLYIVAGGGGGTGSIYGAARISNGGSGGGSTGGNSTVSSIGDEACTGYGGTQSSSGTSSIEVRLRGGFGYGGTGDNDCGGGGGGGLYGGTGGNDYSGGGGGSGYIGGVTDGYTENGVNSGNGKARITYLGAV